MKLRKTAFAFAFAASLIVSDAYGQGLSAAHVLGEMDDDDNIGCDAAHNSAVATVEAALRYNGVKVAPSNSTAVRAYVNVGALKSPSGCVIAFDLIFYVNMWVDDVADLGGRFARVEVCHRGGILVGPPSSIKGRLHESLRDKTNICVSEIAKGE